MSGVPVKQFRVQIYLGLRVADVEEAEDLLRVALEESTEEGRLADRLEDLIIERVDEA